MKVTGEMVKATFLSRPSRFIALVQADCHQCRVHLPNSGRLTGVLVPGAPVLLTAKPGIRRQTSYDLVAATLDHALVWVDSRTANELMAEALTSGALPEFQGFALSKREFAYAGSRLDFLLANGVSQYFLEVKSVTLVRGDKALFPDAPTQRGTKHLKALGRARTEGNRAAIAFVVQRPDADVFSPADQIDPEFGRALRAAAWEGVDVYAYLCRVAAGEIVIGRQIPVQL